MSDDQQEVQKVTELVHFMNHRNYLQNFVSESEKYLNKSWSIYIFPHRLGLQFFICYKFLLNKKVVCEICLIFFCFNVCISYHVKAGIKHITIDDKIL